MFYAFNQTITTSDDSDAKIRLDLDLAAGVIHQVDVLFQDGCNHEAHVQIFQGNLQLWPSNRGNTLRGNATVISFREFFEVSSGLSDLHAMIWGDGTIDAVEVVIQIGLLSKRVLQPMSFEELLSAASGVK